MPEITCDVCKVPTVVRLKHVSFESDYATVTFKTKRRLLICHGCAGRLMKEMIDLYDLKPSDQKTPAVT